MNENEVKSRIRDIAKLESEIAVLEEKSEKLRESILPHLGRGVSVDGMTAKAFPATMVSMLNRPLLLQVLEKKYGFTRFECFSIVRNAEAVYEKRAHVKITMNSRRNKKYRFVNPKFIPSAERVSA